jgi:hypothetical protein
MIITNKDNQLIVEVDSNLLVYLLTMTIQAKRHINEPADLYEEMLKNTLVEIVTLQQELAKYEVTCLTGDTVGNTEE